MDYIHDGCLFVESSQFEGLKKYTFNFPKCVRGRGPLLGSKTEPIKVTVRGSDIWHNMGMAVRGGGAAMAWSWGNDKSGDFIPGVTPLHVRLQ